MRAKAKQHPVVATVQMSRHLARLSRILASPVAKHVVLMSSSQKLGRRSSVKFLAYCNDVVFMETKQMPMTSSSEELKKAWRT